MVGRATLAGGDAVGVLWDTDGVPRALPNSHEGTLINRDGVIGDVRTVGDDGTFGGQRPDAARQHSLPTVWRCGWGSR